MSGPGGLLSGRPINHNLVALATYGVAVVQPQLTAAILTLLYAHVLSLYEFGAYGVLSAVLIIVSIFVELGAGAAILRNYYDSIQKDVSSQIYLLSVAQGTRLVSLIALPIVGTGLFMAWNSLGIGSSQRVLFVALILLAAIFDRSSEVFGAICRATQRPMPFTISRVTQTIVTVGAAIVLVVHLRQGLAGAMTANFVGRFLGATVLEILLFGRINLGLRFDVRDIKACLTFGLPLVPNRILGWARLAALRPVLSHLVPLPAVGLFSLASAVSVVPNLLSTAVDLALSPIYFKRRTLEADDFAKTARRFSKLFVALLFPTWVLMIIFAPSLISLMAGTRFAGAEPACVILFCASFVRTQHQFLFRQMQFLRTTWILPLLMVPVAAISLGVTILWATTSGIAAAAYAALVSDVCLFILLSWRINRIEQPVVPVFFTLLLQGVLVVLAYWVLRGQPVPGGITRFFAQMFILAMACAVTFKFWLWPERQFLRNLILAKDL